MSVKERVARIMEEATGQDLSSWEKGFLQNIAEYKVISAKQEACLVRIEKKFFDIAKDVEPIKTDKFGFDSLDGNPF